ncbi:MAG: protein kinase [Candidatus Zixiibacteriota bacterium]
MALNAGQKLGPYEVTSPVGAGGMGEVYKAKDTRLDRTVAIKVLPSRTAQNADMRSRFEREAKAISSLNHPNICTLHDIGHQDGIDFLVMEYLEGETLSERLKKGPMSTAEILSYGVQIADALDKAHKQGLVHRDLKPANIIITKTGAKLLDFGLAKLKIGEGVVEGVSGLTQSTPLTGAGTILGTLQYMSPEQLEGREADARSDIFAFGAVLYEMTTGSRAFSGNSQASLIASIMSGEPRSITQLSPMSPPILERTIKQCLAKDIDQRWQTAGDLKRALEWIEEGGSQVGLAAPIARRRKIREKGLLAAVALLTVATGWLAWRQFMVSTTPPKVSRFAISPASDLNSVTWPRISPDGTMIAFVGTDSTSQLGIYIRPFNSLDARLLVKVQSDRSKPFWSPDSKQLAYFEGGQLKKVAIAGGLAQIVCEAATGADGSWGSAGVIIFDGNFTDSVRQVSAGGGTPTAATIIDREKYESGTAWPWFLPDGEHFLYLAISDSSADESLLKVGSTKTMESTFLIKVSSRVEYANGHILYMQKSLLVARPFDTKSLQFTGEPIPLSNIVSSDGERTLFSASGDGTLVYQRGQAVGLRTMLWVNRKGDTLGSVGEPDKYLDFSLSPDGTRLAYGLVGEQTTSVDIWVRDLKRNVASRLTFGPSTNAWPIWSLDGNKVIFTSRRTSAHFGVFQRNANGTGADEEIFGVADADASVTSVSQDGKIMTLDVGKANGADIWLLNAATKKAEPLLTQPFIETRSAYSPNGQYLLYQANESSGSDPDVYIRELSPTGGKWQVSTARGRCPKWRADGKEVYYFTPEYDFMAVPISYENGLEIGTPVKLFSKRLHFTGGNSLVPYDVSSDGQRFLLLTSAESSISAEFIVVQNWTEELKR